MTDLPLVAASFAVPDVCVAHGLRLELLGPQHNEADHAAWMSSIAHIRSTPGFDQGWPPVAGMTLAENHEDLAGHAQRSHQRVDFAYSVIDIATGDVVGCVYFEPSSTGEREVAASSWVSAARAELDGLLTEIVGAWLRAAWPFEVVHYRLGEVPVTIRRSPEQPVG
ncbi:hypothetical protein [Salinispora tropica]|uniref:hypothetical protein n=1 Tax=Salinispora tropica TaxID=168695 RepID=UPI0003823E79|nr:hypothetical protein [Salinispora tropica]